MVISNLRLNDNHHLLQLHSTEPLETIYPGQFGNLLVENSAKVLLRRPFSIYSVDYKESTISFFIKIIGEGTRILATTPVGNHISTMFPLGNSFTIPKKRENILVVGGGSGVASLMILSQALSENSNKVSILIGARSSNDLVSLDEFIRFGDVFTTTEDGSSGVKGYVTDHPILAGQIGGFSRIYTCGPEPMMKAVAKMANLNSIVCEVSLENTMACGFGVCLCCITDTTQGHKCVCTDGPVFNIKDLKWQI